MSREMRNSGIEWIGEIPVNWEIGKIKYLFKERNDRCRDINNLELLSVSEYYGIAPRKDKIKGDEILQRSESLEDYKICQINDIVMNIMLAWKGSLGVSEYIGIVSPAYCVYQSISNIDEKYYHYLFRTELYKNIFKQYSTGIIDSRLRLYPEKFLSLYTLIPLISDQQKIVNFLDETVSAIDKVISQTTLSIEEYKKYKQALITEAVTKGLNSDVEMKDSGVEYINKIPLSWTVKRMKYVTTLGPKCNTQKFTNKSIVTFTPMECVKNGSFENRECTYENYNSSYNSFENEDIIVAKVTPCFENGNIAIVNNLYNGYGFGSSELFVLRCTNITNGFMFYYLQNKDFINRAASTMTGTGGLKRVSSDFMKNNKIAIPSIKEQNEIVNFLDNKCSEIESLIAQKQKLLSDLELYKKSLIHECVTGKREVK